ncbi:hypothetical protein UFOVP708_59 [uncultured Caudovirales phage]|uniref:Uncharacterized protein n=1 Tax=uncultured Caudovirales phage TaxID=2100421 RepID=A0A6J5NP72_9CAUD|nr:hypothetical protein UFOVP708_59 [uncultured Caudovirales phage]
MLKRVIASMLIGVSALAFADDSKEFCRGFEEGYKAVAGNVSVTPTCSIAPVTPVGSTPYREGLKAGMQRAKDDGYGR